MALYLRVDADWQKFQQVKTPPKKGHLCREQAKFLSVNDIYVFLISRVLRDRLREVQLWGSFPAPCT